MFRHAMTRNSTLLTIALGLSALGSTIMPAAAFSPAGAHSPIVGNGGFNHAPEHMPWKGPGANAPVHGPIGPISGLPPVAKPPIGNPGNGGGHGPVHLPPIIVERPPVVIQAPPVIVEGPPVYARPRPVEMAPVAAVANTAAAEPCNCLTKQYLDDGSVMFSDVCTHEAALATRDQLQAQARDAAAQPQSDSQASTTAR